MLQIPTLDESREGDGGDGFEEDAADVKARLKVGVFREYVCACVCTIRCATSRKALVICPIASETAISAVLPHCCCLDLDLQWVASLTRGKGKGVVWRGNMRMAATCSPHNVTCSEDCGVQAAQAADAEAELKKRSQVLQRSLPRPATATASSSAPSVEGPPGAGERSNAERLIAHEMANLVAHDDAAYPVAVRPQACRAIALRVVGIVLFRLPCFGIGYFRLLSLELLNDDLTLVASC